MKRFIFFRFQAGYTAIQRAAAEGHVEVVKQLIKHGANVNIQDKVVSLFFFFLIYYLFIFFYCFVIFKESEFDDGDDYPDDQV